MPLSDIQALTSLEKVSEGRNGTSYRCWIDGGVSSMLKNGSVRAGNEPYLLLFDADGKLKEMAFDDPKAPTIFEQFIDALGCKTIDYPYKTECCGSFLTASTPNLSVITSSMCRTSISSGYFASIIVSTSFLRSSSSNRCWVTFNLE